MDSTVPAAGAGARYVTPHDGGARPAGGRPVPAGEDRLVTAARTFCPGATAACLVLKGHRTIVSLPDGEVFVNTTGNSGMAKGGSGDVLGGILVSLLAQGMRPVKAAACAVWIHGRAGDLCAQSLGERGMTPSDMIRALPKVFQELE